MFVLKFSNNVSHPQFDQAPRNYNNHDKQVRWNLVELPTVSAEDRIRNSVVDESGG